MSDVPIFRQGGAEWAKKQDLSNRKESKCRWSTLTLEKSCTIHTSKPLGSEGFEKNDKQCDYATINQLICISNMENINAVMLNDGVPQPQRLNKLNEIAIQQMRILSEVERRNNLK